MNNRSYLGSITIYDLLGCGSHANVHFAEYLETNVAYKEFCDPKYVESIKDEIIKLSEFRDDNKFVFPNKFIYEKPSDELFRGYTMTLLNGYKPMNEMIITLDKDKKIELLFKARELLHELHKKYKFIHADVAPWNFMYNKEIDSLILTDFDTSLEIKNNIVINSECHNDIVIEYAKYNNIDENLDVFLFNLCCYSVLNNVDIYYVLRLIRDNKYGTIESDKAKEIFNSYKSLDKPKSLKKEYVIDYL